jgi:thiamine-monophosphate kinase
VVSEFDLIQKYFTRPSEHTLLGVGDDAALMQLRPGKVLAVSTDMLVAGRHFFPDTDPYRLGRKTLAVNLSDLAAMGAEPRWTVLSLAIPQPDSSWLKPFAQGFYDEAQAHHVDWVGGDTTSGPLNVSVTIMGEVEQDLALQRSGAQVGDDIWVSGTLGDAAMGLACLNNQIRLAQEGKDFCVLRLEQPTARVDLGLRLAGLAHAAIDLSDGLMADLGHLLTASAVGADIAFAALPQSVALQKCPYPAQVQEVMLGGGDDYELCFTASPEVEQRIVEAGRLAQTQVTKIGTIVSTRGLRVLDPKGALIIPKRRGFDHFAEQSAQQ